MSTAELHAAIDAARLARDARIQTLPAVIECNLAMYDQCFDLAMAAGDHHGANNWAQMRVNAVGLLEMVTA